MPNFDNLFGEKKASNLTKLARKQKEILYQGNECQNIFTSLTHTRQTNGNIVWGCENAGRI